MKKWKVVLPVVCAAVVIAGLSFMVTVKADENDNVIPRNIYIGEIAVGGMTREEAQEAVDQYIAENSEAVLTLEADKNSVEASLEDLGVAWGNPSIVDDALNYGKTGNLLERYKAKKDLEKESKVFRVAYAIDEEKAAAFLEAHAEELNQEVIDSTLSRVNGAFEIVSGQEGVEIDTDASVETMHSFFAEEWTGGDASITLTANVVEPRGTEEELSKVQDLMGSYSTNYSDSAAGRKANINNAVSKINGSVIYPGDEYSVSDAISPLSASNGYELAGSYENGTIVESYGGGVCQVSTTLYNALILSELEITERFAHSMVVSYVEPSMDAAIATGLKDLKFKNNTDAPIYIEGYCDGGNVYFNVYGQDTREEGRKVSFYSEITSTEEPTTEFVTSDDPIGFFSVQSAHIGQKARLWKIVTVNGVEQSREVFNSSTYKAAPRTITVGMASDYPEAVGAMNAALATQEEAVVRQAAHDWSNEAIAQRQQLSETNTSQQVPAEENGSSGTTTTDTTSPGTTTTDTTTSDTTTPDTTTPAQ